MRYALQASRIAIAILLASCAGQPPRAIPIEMKGIAFVPSAVRAHAGDTLVFRNRDLVPHTATARDHSWDSGSIAPDSTWRVVVKMGVQFYCTFHPTMTGSVTRGD